MKKRTAEQTERERVIEQQEGIAERPDKPAASDRPENETPHPQDVNEIGEE